MSHSLVDSIMGFTTVCLITSVHVLGFYLPSLKVHCDCIEVDLFSSDERIPFNNDVARCIK